MLRCAPFHRQLYECLEDAALQGHHILQRDLRPVCQNQEPFQFPELLQPAGGGQVGPSVLFFIRLEPGNCDLWLLVYVLQQNRLFSVQLRPGVLVQLHPSLRQPCSLRDGGPVAAQGGEGAEDGGPVADGHPGVPLGGGMRKIYDVVVWPAHA